MGDVPFRHLERNCRVKTFQPAPFWNTRHGGEMKAESDEEGTVVPFFSYRKVNTAAIERLMRGTMHMPGMSDDL